MAVRSVVVTLTGGVDLIVDGTNGSSNAPVSALIKPVSTNAAVVDLGGSDVSAANGYPLAATDPAIGVDLFAGDILYAKGTAGDKLYVLKTRS